LPAIEQHAPPGLVVGLKAGLGTGKPIRDLGLQHAFELELGYLLPLLDPFLHAFELFVSTGYVGSSLSGHTSQPDGRLAGDGKVSYTVRERSLSWGAGLRFRVPLRSERLAPYLALGYRGFGTADVVKARVAGQAVSSSTERGLSHGFFASAGLELFVGPGAVLAELQLARAARDPLVMRGAIGGMQVFVGYRLMFGEPAPRPRQAAPAVLPQPLPPPTAAQQAPAPEPDSSEGTTTDETAIVAAAETTSDSQIRGVVRSFRGQPILAHVLVEPGARTAETGPGGEFSLNVPPGRYTVTLRAEGFAPQTKTCVVDQAGITVLNVELRDE
jgi:hypothetical protein